MGFDTYATETKQTNNSNKPTVDFDALNKYVVETCGLQEPKTLRGVISVIVDLGTQKQPDAEYKLEDADKGLTVEQLTEKYKADMAENFDEKDKTYKVTKFANTYDNDSKSWMIKKFVKQPPRQSITYAVDFPDIIIDKGQFFGESKPLPLRLWFGGQYWNQYIGEKGAMVVQNLIPNKVVNIGDDKSKVWSLNPRSTVHKMAVASELIKTGQPFVMNDVDKLLGKTLLFTAQVFMNPSKGGKEYYTEKLKFSSGLVMGMPACNVENTYLIQFNQENDPEALKELRKHVITTIQQATNYEGSKIQQQLEDVRPHTVVGDAQESPVPQTPKPTTVPEETESDCPF